MIPVQQYHDPPIPYSRSFPQQRKKNWRPLTRLPPPQNQSSSPPFFDHDTEGTKALRHMKDTTNSAQSPLPPFKKKKKDFEAQFIFGCCYATKNMKNMTHRSVRSTAD